MNPIAQVAIPWRGKCYPSSLSNLRLYRAEFDLNVCIVSPAFGDEVPFANRPFMAQMAIYLYALLRDKKLDWGEDKRRKLTLDDCFAELDEAEDQQQLFDAITEALQGLAGTLKPVGTPAPGENPDSPLVAAGGGATTGQPPA